MSSAAVTAGQGPAQVASGRIVRLWRDTKRVEQLARLQGLELQPGDDFGQRARELAFEQWRQLPEGARVDLPSARVFGRVLGVMRTGATLKTGKILQFELSAADIASLVGYSKSTVEAALRWLGCNPIEHQGQQVARGIGLLHRGRRTGWGYIKGMLQRLYRTSRLGLTLFGRLVLGLASREDERTAEKRQAREGRRKPATPIIVRPERREEEHVRGQGGAAPPPPPEASPPEAPSGPDVGKTWLRKIQQALR